jgi:uncharacterized protein
MEDGPFPAGFEWDPVKAASNWEKHDVGFSEAVLAFDDRFRLDELNRTTEYGEERRNAIGLGLSGLLVVSYTFRNGKRRLISARRARKDERYRYYRSKIAG